MNWRVLRDAVHSPGDLPDVAKKSGPVLYSDVLRPCLPKTGEVTKYNDIVVTEERWLDPYLPSYFMEYVQSESQANYEGPLIEEVREHVSAGDTVVVIGGGIGVSAAVAARMVGEDGFVHIYEGSEKHTKLIANTLRLNDVQDRCQIHHAIVSEAKNLRAHPGAADVVGPDELPDCDLLEMDCEGAEIDIIERIHISPSTIVVETHGHLDVPTPAIEEVLANRDYDVVNRRTVNEERGIDILTAVANH